MQIQVAADRRARGLGIALACGAMLFTGCTSTEQAEQAAAPSASVMCGTVITSLAALQQNYDDLDAGVEASQNPATLQPIGAQINSLTFDVVNQLQGASKESLTTVQTAAQRIVDTLVLAQRDGTTGEALAAQLSASQPADLDSAVADLTTFANQACAGQ